MRNSLRILVTGGAGFVGSHLCRRLLIDGHHVLCLDNLSTGKLENIKDFKSNSNFEFIKHDIVFPIKVEVNRIYNLACPASPVHYQSDAIQTTKTSVLGALNMLDLAEQTGAKILHCSTSEVYGDPHVHPQHEDYWGHVNPVGLRSCYDEGKRCAESLFFDYSRQRKVNVRVVRIFNTYGPNMDPDDGRVVSNFIVQALKGNDLTVYGDGSQTRSFQFIDDLIDGMVLMMENDKNFSGPVNIGNPSEFTIRELADQVLRMIPSSDSSISFNPLPSDDPQQRRPDISLAKKVLGWEPKVSLRDGLSRTIEYFQFTIT